MNHVQQPNDYTCGPACVAVLTGEPIDKLIAEMRPTPKNGTWNKGLINALRRHGIICADRFESARGRQLPELCIVRIITIGMCMGHVVVKNGRTWYDSVLPGPFEGDLPAGREWNPGSHVASFLRVSP